MGCGQVHRTVQAIAAEEVEAQPEGAVIVGMLSDYAVLRDQARACGGGGQGALFETYQD